LILKSGKPDKSLTTWSRPRTTSEKSSNQLLIHLRHDRTQTQNPRTARPKPRSRSGEASGESNRGRTPTRQARQTTGGVRWVRSKIAEGAEWEMHVVRAQADIRKEKSEKDLHGLRDVAESGVSNSNRNQK
jgi:hypothetical protein